jgi:hypothetical protein
VASLIMAVSSPNPCAAANPDIALWLQSTPPAGRVAELESLDLAWLRKYGILRTREKVRKKAEKQGG